MESTLIIHIKNNNLCCLESLFGWRDMKGQGFHELKCSQMTLWLFMVKSPCHAIFHLKDQRAQQPPRRPSQGSSRIPPHEDKPRTSAWEARRQDDPRWVFYKRFFRGAILVTMLRCHLKQKFYSASLNKFFMALWVTEHLCSHPSHGGT